MAMSFVFRAVQQSMQVQSRAIVLAVAGIGAMLLVFGTLFSIIAMCAVPRYGTAKILGRSIVGFLANGLLLFIGVTGFINGRQQALARQASAQDAWANARQYQTEVARNYDPKLGVTNSRAGAVQIKRLDNQIQNATRNATGDEAVVLQVLSEQLKRMQSAVNRYEIAAQKYPDILNPAGLTDKTVIERRRETVRTLISANNEVKQLVINKETSIRADLAKRGIAPATIEATVQSYRRNGTSRAALSVKIRDCEQRRADATLQVLNLFESDWGHWRYDSKSAVLHFENAQSESKYSKLFDEIEAAEREEVKLQGQLLNVR